MPLLNSAFLVFTITKGDFVIENIPLNANAVQATLQTKNSREMKSMFDPEKHRFDGVELKGWVMFDWPLITPLFADL